MLSSMLFSFCLLCTVPFFFLIFNIPINGGSWCKTIPSFPIIIAPRIHCTFRKCHTDCIIYILFTFLFLSLDRELLITVTDDLYFLPRTYKGLPHSRSSINVSWLKQLFSGKSTKPKEKIYISKEGDCSL